jgi:hypothetical protein
MIDFPLTINYKEIAEAKDMLPITRLMALNNMSRPYAMPGEFIRNLPDPTLSELLEIFEDENNPYYSELILITEMLVQAEGLQSMSTEDIMAHLKQLNVYLILEKFVRTNIVKKVYHENMSFGDDMKTKVIVEKHDGSQE